MAKIVHTCTGCVPIDASILKVYAAMVAAISESHGMVVDDALSGVSKNPVENRVITNALASKYAKPVGGIPASDIAPGVIPDVSEFVTKSVSDLMNYYLKSETYTKTEVQELIGAIQGFSYEIVASLPTATAETIGKIYLVPSSDPQTQNVKDEFITIDNGASENPRYTWEQIGSTSVNLEGYVTTEQLNTVLADYTTTANLTTLLAGKQDVIQDLSTIRSGAAAGATAYQKPGTGIPASDLADGVIPTVPTISTDVSADAASDVKTSSPKSVKTYVDAGIAAVESDLSDLADEVEAIDIGAYVVAWDGNSEPVVANIPAGVVVAYGGTNYTGTLAASASTIQKIYLVATGTTDNYDRYITVGDSTYSWVNIGTTEITLSDYAPKAEVSQLEAKVSDVIIGGDAPNLFDIDNATARDNSSDAITWSVSNGVLTMSTSSGTNVHLYINLQGTTAGKTYKLTAKITNANQAVIIRHSGTSSYDTMTNDGEDYSLTFVSTGEDWFDFLFRNRTITMTDVVLVSTEVSPKSVNPEYVKGLTLGNFTPETAKELSAFDDVFQPTFPTITPTLTSGSYIKADGTIGSSTPYSYTAPIHLDAGTVLTVTTAQNYDTSVVAIISETDSGATFYNPVSIGDGSGVHTYIAKREVYVALSFATADYSISAISSPLFGEIFGNESSEDYTYFLASIIGKYTALGDSLTAGHIFNSDAPSGYAYTDFTFPTIIGRAADAETDIVAIGGYTSKQLYNAAAELIDYANTNLFTIWLGTNDGYTLTSYADVNPDDGWENYPDTFVGAYCKLVDRIRETNPNAIVVLINIQSGGANGDTGSTLESTQATISKIAEDRGLLCIDTSAYTRQLKPSWHGLNGGNIHFSIFGYQNLAKIFMSEIGAYLYAHPELVEKVYALPAKKYTGVVRLLS